MATSPSTPSPNAFVPTEASRVRGFATFFKSYMSVWTLVVAALPIPVGAFKLIPTFEIQRFYLSVYTPLFCFLSLGFIFFQRHSLGRYMFQRDTSELGSSRRRMILARTQFVNWLPLCCILLSAVAVFQYDNDFNDAILIGRAQATAEDEKGTVGGALSRVS